MNIIETTETIEIWINSCKKREQLDMLYLVVHNFIDLHKFPDETIPVLTAARAMLYDKIKYKKEQLLLTTYETN